MEANLEQIKVLIVDDQSLIRRAIQIHLEQESDLEVVGWATNGKEAIEKIAELEPNVVILDLEMPDMDGLTATKIIRDRFRQIKTLVLSSHDDREHINQAIDAGAKGYLTKGTPARELASAVRSVHQGYFQLGPGLMEKLVIAMSNASQAQSRSLEEKLVIALKRFKQDSNRQIEKLIKVGLQDVGDRTDLNNDSHIRHFHKRYNHLDNYIKRVEFRLYLLLLIQIVSLFVFIAYWIVNA